MLDSAEVLMDAPLSAKAERLLKAMAAAAPEGSAITENYAGRHRVLMLYGPGSPARLPLVAKHKAAGGHVAMWDMGYWDRQDSMRLAIDTMHPTAEQLEWAPDGPGRREFELRNDFDPEGPILLIGLGAKSVLAYGLPSSHGWERKKLAELRERFPKTGIAWRPKGAKPVHLAGLSMRHGMPIEDAMNGCSLVVCRHSNAAIDACVAGIPVECEDGAAHALYRDNPNPSLDERREFLRRLTWWEWSRFEAPGAWSWIQRFLQ